MTNAIAEDFTETFTELPLAIEIEHCDHNEMAALFRQRLPPGPVLEAGCGSGRWVAWFIKNGWQATGVDWSEELCARARRQIPGGRFICADLRSVPLPDGAFNSLIALGTVEHAIDGPMPVLRELNRLLAPGGVAIITVPHGGWLRKTIETLCEPRERLKAVPLIRQLAGKKTGFGASRRSVLRGCVRRWLPLVVPDLHGYHFYEYRFNRSQMRCFLRESGFQLVREDVAYKEDGVYHHFGRLAAAYDRANARFRFTLLGRLLRATLPRPVVGHMLVYTVRKSTLDASLAN